MTNAEMVEDILRRTGALLPDGHYVYTSRQHGAKYVNVRVLRRPEYGRELAAIGTLIADLAHAASPDVLVVPESADVWLGPPIADALTLTLGVHVELVSARKSSARAGESSDFRVAAEDIERVRGKRVLVVDDTVNLGGSVARVLEAVRGAGGNIVQFACVVNRTARLFGLGDSREVTLLHVPATSFPPGKGSCPLCDAEVPVNTDVGHGAAYLRELQGG